MRKGVHPMSKDSVSLSTFPDSAIKALALVYVQSRSDLNEKTAAEIHTLYREAYKEISNDYNEKRNSGYKFR